MLCLTLGTFWMTKQSAWFRRDTREKTKIRSESFPVFIFTSCRLLIVRIAFIAVITGFIVLTLKPRLHVVVNKGGFSRGRNLRQQPFRCTTALSQTGSMLLELLIIVYPFFIVLAITNKSSSYVLRGWLCSKLIPIFHSLVYYFKRKTAFL